MRQNKLFLFVLFFSVVTSGAFAQTLGTANCGGAYTYTGGASSTRKVTSGFGQREAPSTVNGGQGSSNHQGVDIGMGGSNTTRDYNAYATVSGKVIAAGPLNGLGNTVIVESNGVRYSYGHASSINVKEGDTVSVGQVLSNYSGASTGNTTAPHIHYSTQVNVNGVWTNVDPAIVEQQMTSGNCPTSANFAQTVLDQTKAKHPGLTLKQGGNIQELGKSVCDK